MARLMGIYEEISIKLVTQSEADETRHNNTSGEDVLRLRLTSAERRIACCTNAPPVTLSLYGTATVKRGRGGKTKLRQSGHISMFAC